MNRIKEKKKIYLQQLNSKKGDEFELLGEYKDQATKTTFKHIKCGYIWEVKPGSLLHSKYGCPKCSKNPKSNTKLFKEEVENLYPHKFEVLSEYINAKTKVQVKHIECGEVFTILPYDLKKRGNCPHCSKKNKGRNRAKTTEQYTKEVFELVNTEYSVSGDYYNWKTKMEFTHNVCGNVFLMEANSFLQGRRCPKCQKKKNDLAKTMTNQQFLDKLFAIYEGEYIPKEKYVNNATNIMVKHNKCGHVWKVRPANLLTGFGCPRCKQSKGEKVVYEVLKNSNIKFDTQKKFSDLKDKKELSFDFYFEYNNSAYVIEYQGQQHYFPVEIFGGDEQFKRQKEHDAMKRKYCKDNNLILLEIPYTQTTYSEIKILIDTLLT